LHKEIYVWMSLTSMYSHNVGLHQCPTAAGHNLLGMKWACKAECHQSQTWTAGQWHQRERDINI